MRIALIGPVYPYRGGIAHYTTMLDRALKADGHEVLLVSFVRQYPDWLFPGKSDQDPSESGLRVDNAQYWIDSLNPFTWLKAFRRIAKFYPDRIVLQWWTPFWALTWTLFGFLSHVFLETELVYLCHNVLPHEERKWHRWVAKTVLHWGDAYNVHSVEEKRRLLALLPEATVSVNPHPVYGMFSKEAQPTREEARFQLELPSEAHVLLFFGIIRPYKGLKSLIQALPIVLEEYADIQLLIAGEFWEDVKIYESLIHAQGVASIVSIENRYIPNEEVSMYFRAADILVAPYVNVTGSGVTQLALGYGLPMVVTWDLPDSICRSVRHSTAIPGDVRSLGRAIIDLLDRLEGETRPPADERAALQHRSWEALCHFISAESRV
jgi:glycosyltransferase involved in cell wall biosynthesis